MNDEVPAVYVRDLSLEVPDRQKKGEIKALLDRVSFDVAPGTFTAIIGSSGCGKTTLVRLLAGLRDPSEGAICLAGHDPRALRVSLPLAIGYLPQFSAFHDALTVRETLADALALRLPHSVSKADRQSWLESVIDLVGLRSQIDQACETLSGGQKRRLALAEELLGDPPVLFLDELTSGLDPNSELEMMRWIHDLVRQTGKTVVMVTHSVNNLDQCDQILFLHEGQLLYSGSHEGLLPFFGLPTIEAVYAAAGSFPSVSQKIEQGKLPLPQPLRTAQPAGSFAQFPALLSRQFRLLFRDRGQLWLQVLLLFSFPALVAVFALDGLPAVQNLSMEVETSIVEGLAQRLTYMSESFDVAALVQGLSMFQVILLTLMGANNGAREIAKERLILHKELRAGLSAFAYLATKILQVLCFSLIQSFWMVWFVKEMCGFPGSFAVQFLTLFMATFAMSATCLFFSALASSPEKASLLSTYLVGLQLPLSGAVLALPEVLRVITQPFIAAYWGWSGYLRSLEAFRHYDVVQQVSKTSIAGYWVGIVVLGLHVIVMTLVAWLVIRQRRKGLV